MIGPEEADALTGDEVVEVIRRAGGIVSATEIASALGGYESGTWTSTRLYVRLRDVLRTLRDERRIGKLGGKRNARYAVTDVCVCGHPREDHVFDAINPAGECVTQEEGPICECAAFAGRLPPGEVPDGDEAPEEEAAPG